MSDNGITWLKEHFNNNDNLDKLGFKERANILFKQLTTFKTSNLPQVIGIFGGWGSGKTSFLSLLVQQIEEEHEKNEDDSKMNIIYFNAWKYAGCDITSALLYKILKLYMDNNDNSKAKLLEILKYTLNKSGKTLAEFSKMYTFGINIYEAGKQIHELLKVIPDYENKILEQYYTNIDKIEEELNNIFENKTNKTIIIIDELDRCEPTEAFEVIKQLRVFFSIKNTPLIFLLSVNPDPIGLAIKHKYGLQDNYGDYEAKRILEKYVDFYINVSNINSTKPNNLSDYVKDIWLKKLKIDNSETLNYLTLASKKDDTINNLLTPIDTNNNSYRNLRVLKKSLDFIIPLEINKNKITEILYNGNYWTKWHLEIIKNIDYKLREEISRCASSINKITKDSYNSINELTDDNTFFERFKNQFWVYARQELKELQSRNPPSPEQIEQIRILHHFLSDWKRMDILIQISLISNTDNFDEFQTLLATY